MHECVCLCVFYSTYKLTSIVESTSKLNGVSFTWSVPVVLRRTCEAPSGWINEPDEALEHSLDDEATLNKEGSNSLVILALVSELLDWDAVGEKGMSSEDDEGMVKVLALVVAAGTVEATNPLSILAMILRSIARKNCRSSAFFFFLAISSWAVTSSSGYACMKLREG